MLGVNKGSSCSFKFLFIKDGQAYDPISQSTPLDVVVNVYRGEYGSGSLIDGPYSYLSQGATPSSDIYIEKNNYGEFTFYYKIPENLFEGVYTVVASTLNNDGLLTLVTLRFSVVDRPTELNPIVISTGSSTSAVQKPLYEQINLRRTGTVVLVGHADGIPLNEPVRIKSIDEGINLLNADINSPLMRGLLEVYAAGCRDIIICASARMFEYVADYSSRNISSDFFEISSTTPSSKTFYEKYYERLNDTYAALLGFDDIDYIVPLETSIIKTDGVDFITQLATFCAENHNKTGYVSMGVIGSVTGGFSSSHINDIKNNSVLSNKLTTYNLNGTVSSDYGRFVIPIYGEATFKHPQIKTSYVSSVSAAVAGMLAAAPLNIGMIRKRIPNAMFVFGTNLTNSDYSEMDDMGMNSIYRGTKTRRSTPYEVYLTNEYTLANSNSTLSKAAQMRLVSSVIREIKNYAHYYIGKFGHDEVSQRTKDLLESYKKNSVITDYSFNMTIDRSSRGSIRFDIELLSSLGLKTINFGLSAGPVV